MAESRDLRCLYLVEGAHNATRKASRDARLLAATGTRRRHECRRPARELDRSGFSIGARSSGALMLRRRALNVIVAISLSSSRFLASISRIRASIVSKRSV